MARPRAADDFATIQARLKEIRRERTQVVPDQDGHSVVGERSNRITRRDAKRPWVSRS